MYNCRMCKKDFKETTMKDKGGMPYYCSDDCYSDSYQIMEEYWQRNNHDIEKTRIDFAKNFLLQEKYPNNRDHKAIEIKDGKKIEYR